MQDNKRPEGKGRTVRDALHSRAFKNGAYASVLCAVMLALDVYKRQTVFLALL